jgi:hypothetical protein
MRWVKRILLVLFIAIIVIQFIQPVRNSSGQAFQSDISKVYTAPDKVLALLKNSCYDCHSNNTRYPWYSYIQPGGWWMASHINKGKGDLNFSEFGNYSTIKQKHKLQSIANSLTDGTMPISAYTLIHSNAMLSKEDRVLILDWIKTTKDSLSQKN